ncbi:Crp/Fnr family transcriptional regulator [Paracoccus gahaiensis]|uniref:Crp/Fnr family transcriptional regulator n=1 Tax=Paracoccus gahaiensis TaxID=1706839 RepID=A0A4U0R551_9RHOB|nr:Crp/Fnr family transcriptional regulator [Paracoccus gahaiensis]TJZ89947.1 Crp/Fnr family transcriptional regulator [Paracoccus gahaiensis]
MRTPLKNQTTHENQLLGAFPFAARQLLEQHLEPVEMDLGATICEAGGQLKHAYFPQGCVLSLLTVLENGSEIECANIGREGAFGLFAAMYSGVSYNRCTIQLEGSMLRCRIEPLRELFQHDLNIQDLFVSFSETLLSQVMQTVGCNSLHSVEERMCRWLLMMHDRAEGDRLTYTHEFLARIMGANRTSITHAAQSLQRKGLITYRRGLMQIEDRVGMEAEACECYEIVRKRFDAFLTPPPSASQKTTGHRVKE